MELGASFKETLGAEDCLVMGGVRNNGFAFQRGVPYLLLDYE